MPLSVERSLFNGVRRMISDILPVIHRLSLALQEDHHLKKKIFVACLKHSWPSDIRRSRNVCSTHRSFSRFEPQTKSKIFVLRRIRQCPAANRNVNRPSGVQLVNSSFSDRDVFRDAFFVFPFEFASSKQKNRSPISQRIAFFHIWPVNDLDAKFVSKLIARCFE